VTDIIMLISAWYVLWLWKCLSCVTATRRLHRTRPEDRTVAGICFLNCEYC